MASPAAIVLTGGASRRMGVDKATLSVDGRRLCDRLLDELEGAGIATRIVAGPDPGGLPADVIVAPDDGPEHLGPLAGLSAGWAALRGSDERFDPIVVLSCDLPRVDRSMIGELVRHAEVEEFGAVAHDGRRSQPLVAAYRRRTIERLEAAFRAGERSISRVLAEMLVAVVSFEPSLLRDADRPSDLEGHDVAWPSPDSGSRPSPSG